MNLARPKKKNSDHTAQHGMELGFKIPTLTRIIILSWALNSNTEGSIACISIMCLLIKTLFKKGGFHCERPLYAHEF
ncbi:hypothetical protein HpBT344_08820 [Helicobacter pylori]